MPHRWNEVINEDCLEGLKKIESGVVDLAFADPPFNIGYEYDEYNDSQDREQYLRWSQLWTAEVVRVLKSNGTFWLAIGDEYAAELKVMLQEKHRLFCRSWVVWYYTFGVNCSNNFSRSHTHLFYLVKNPKSFTFNSDSPSLRVPSARQLVYADRRANPRGRLPDNSWILRPQDIPEAFIPSDDTWYFSRVCGTFKERTRWHTCQMPERLLGRIIEACSHPGELVLDPFSGSGTTLAVAKKLGRKYLGYELSKRYSQEAKKRLSKIHLGDPLEGVVDPVISVPATANGRTLLEKSVKVRKKQLAQSNKKK
ncbi:MAG: site-specific DNA-methyltransferase [Pirellulales bacterium]|nr:site-specific DNA-methyltransferase [Pirellulales bacterium]